MGLNQARAVLDGWLSDPSISGLVIDTDSDGLLAAIYLQEARRNRHPSLAPWPVRGAYDMERLWLDTDLTEQDWPRSVLLIDVDARVDRARVMSQHVITDRRARWTMLSRVPPQIELLNPNYALVDNGHRAPYEQKYPFSTAAWAALLLGHEPLTPDGDPMHWATLMAQDSSLRNGIGLREQGRYWDNCRTWAVDRMRSGTLAMTYAATSADDEHRDAGAAADLQAPYLAGIQEWVRRLPEGPGIRLWKEQWAMDLPSTRRSGRPRTLQLALRATADAAGAPWGDWRLPDTVWASRLPRDVRRQRLRLAAETEPAREPFTLARTAARTVKLTSHGPVWPDP